MTLKLRSVICGWGHGEVLHNINLDLNGEEATGIVGHNGSGKTTLISTIAGRSELISGYIELNDRLINDLRPFERARMGIGLVPQEREIFNSLTVEENLHIGRTAAGWRNMRNIRTKWTEERVYELFPGLQRRRRSLGGVLSGGEKQMLSIGRALMGDPKLLLLDEPFEGLAPVVVNEVADIIKKLRTSDDLSIIVTDQNIARIEMLVDKIVVLKTGEIVYSGMMNDETNPQIHEEIVRLLRIGVD